MAEAKRLRALDAKYDWDDMLVQANVLDAELPRIAPFIRKLAHVSDTVGTDLTPTWRAPASSKRRNKQRLEPLVGVAPDQALHSTPGQPWGRAV